MRLRSIIFILLLCSFLPSFAKSMVYRISTQIQFDELNTSIRESVSRGYNRIRVVLAPKIFYFNEDHLVLGFIKNATISIEICGNGATIVPIGKDVETKKVLKDYDYNAAVVKPELLLAPTLWTEVCYAEADVEVINTQRKLCRLKCNDNIFTQNEFDNDQFLMITAWCRTYTYKITKYEAPYIYFVADNLADGISFIKSRKGYNVNNDYISAGVTPRYRLYNTKPLSLGKAHVCEAQTFINVSGGEMGSLTIKGITFLGNRCKGIPEATYSSLIVLYNLKAKNISIKNCNFIGQKSRILMLFGTDNVNFENNYVSHNYRYGIQSDNTCKRTIVKNNEFENNGEDMSYDRCVSCSGTDYYIGRNTFKNFGYCAISVGVWYGNKENNSPRGVVEYNNILYTDEWKNNLWKYTIMDGGAIYLWTKNDRAIIRYNRIDGYGGVAGNRGIFCDDGAFGFQIYGNVITNIGNNDYCIASRREPSVEKKNYPGSTIERSNINNIIRDNIFDGKILFRGHEDTNNGCVKGINYILLKKSDAPPRNIIDNIPDLSEDVTIYSDKKINGRFSVSRSDYRLLRKSKEWSFIKKYLKSETRKHF